MHSLRGAFLGREEKEKQGLGVGKKKEKGDEKVGLFLDELVFIIWGRGGVLLDDQCFPPLSQPRIPFLPLFGKASREGGRL